MWGRAGAWQVLRVREPGPLFEAAVTAVEENFYVDDLGTKPFEPLEAGDVCLLQLATDMDGETFVPGLYRQLAHWPAYLAHIATELGPVFGDPAMTRECDGVRERIAADVPFWLAGLGEVPPPPADAPTGHILAAIETYQGTSPQMICFGRLLREALPD